MLQQPIPCCCCGAGIALICTFLPPGCLQVKRLERMLAIEDLMYICILEKFQVCVWGGWCCKVQNSSR